MIKKIVLVSVIAISSLFASTDDLVIQFEKNRLAQNAQVKLKSVEIKTKVQLPMKNWYGYILDINAEVQGKVVKAKDMLFSDGKFATPELFDIKTGESFKSYLAVKLTSKYYDKKHLIKGTQNAKNKVVLFSDPLCPFCTDYIPEVIKHFEKNSKDIALYYYHFPLVSIHPAAQTLSALMVIAHKKGVKDVVLKTYTTDWSKYYEVSETNADVILKAFNKEFKLDIKKSELKNNEIVNSISNDLLMGEEVGVNGTPTIFVNDKKDDSRSLYKKLGM